MSVRSRNWLKFGGLVGLAFALGLLFAGLLDLPSSGVAQQQATPVLPARGDLRSSPINGTQPLTTLSDAFAAVVEHVRPSVVYITSMRTGTTTARRLPPGFEQFFQRQEPQVERGSGSGFIVSNDGYILTNNHVVENAERVQVRLLDRREFTAKVIGSDPTTDVAVLKIDATGLTPATLGQSGSARVGEWVLAIGNPLGEGLTFTVTSGIVSAKGRGSLGLGNNAGLGIQDFIQTDAAINPGNSGGPLVNVRGEVIGINSAIASQTGYNVGYGFAIPIDLANNVMSQLIATGKVQRSVLGVSVQDVTEEAAEYAGLDRIHGVIVQGFTGTNSPAERAGLERGDIIVSVDGQPVDYIAQLQQMVGFRKPGEVVRVEVARRNGARKTYQIRLTAQDPEELASGAQPAEDRGSPSRDGSELSRLGIRMESLTPEWTRNLRLPTSVRAGVVVTSITPGGPAERAGLIPADRGVTPDIITEVDGSPVRNEAELRAALQNASGVVALTVYNRGVNQGLGESRIVHIRLDPK